MPYSKTTWEDYPSTATPVNASNLNNAETGIETAQSTAEAATASAAAAQSTADAATASAAAANAGTATNATAISDHIADATSAHSASAIGVSATGGITSTDVQAALAELDAEISAGGIPGTIVDAKGDLIGATADDTPFRVAAATADDLVLTSDSAQATGVKWAAPSSGVSSLTALSDVEGGTATPLTGEAPVYTGSQFEYVDIVTAAELATHEADTTSAHVAQGIDITDSGAYYTGTEVETALQEVGADIVALQAAPAGASIGMILVLGG